MSGTPVISDAVAALFDTVAGDKEKMMENAKPGDYVLGKGIYIGQWQRGDRDGTPLSAVFNVFAAPQDLQDDAGARVMLTYNDTLEHLSRLKDWKDHDGKAYADDKALFRALEDGSYDGEWVIPPLDVLEFIGRQTYDFKTCPIDDWKLGKTFYMGDNSFTDGYPSFYWSSTFDGHQPPSVFTAHTGGLSGISSGGVFRTDDGKISCRPVRFEPVPEGGI
jgi:hypothetical protein